MKRARDWADEMVAQVERMLDPNPKVARMPDPLMHFIRQIQTDALKAAAESVSEIGRDGRQWVPNSLWDTLAKEHSALILSLIPKEGE